MIDLDAAEKLCAAATASPDFERLFLSMCYENMGDGLFVTQARTLLPEALAELRSARAELRALRKVAEAAQEYVGFAHLPCEPEIAASCERLFLALDAWEGRG